jgi:HD superfamily phosphohydrolase
MEKKLTAATGLAKDSIIIDVCEDYGKGSIVRVLMEDNSLVQLSKVSAIVDSVSIAEQRRWRAIVACDTANLEKVKKAGTKLFGGLVK